jgi:hypothetical protein
MPVSSPSLTSLTLSVTGTRISPPDYVAVTTTYGPQNLPLDNVNLGDNTVTITDQRILDAFTNSPLGTTFKASIQSSYANGLSIIESVSNTVFIPDQVTTSLSLAPIVKTFGDNQFSLLSYVTTNSKADLTFTIGDASIATLSDVNKLNILTTGSTTISVSQAAYGIYTSANVTASLVVNPIAPTFTFSGSTITNGQFTITSQTLGATTFTPTYPTSNSAGAYTYASSDASVATVNATTGAITIVNAGTTTITLSQAAAGNYTSGSVQASLVVMYKWVKQGADIDGEAFGDKSGYSVSLSNDGSMVAIGTPNNNNVGGTDAGQVRVYKLTGNLWVKQGEDINGSSAGDQSGYSVSLSNDGSFVAIGAPTNDGKVTNSGHIRVYKYVNNAWVKQGADIEGEYSNDNSGRSVSISNNGLIVAIGAPNTDNVNGIDAGQVRVYKLIGSTWTKQGGDINGEAAYDESGTSVSLSSDGSIVAIGAPNNNNGNGTATGHVRVYKLIGSTWTKQGGDINGEAANDNSGRSVSLSEDGLTIAIGAPNNNNGNESDAGHVRVYKYANGSWTKQGGDIIGEAAGDHSGTNVSLSSDGSIVAIGAPNNDGNGTNAGQVRVYKLIGNSWVKQYGDIDGEAANDNSGYSVSLSGNGLIVAIGAYENDDNGTGAGQVRVYKYMLSA